MMKKGSYTRFPNDASRHDLPPPRGLEEKPTNAERLFGERPARPLTRDERTSQVARKIVLEESEKRRTLSQALRDARLERAERFTESASNKRLSSKDR